MEEISSLSEFGTVPRRRNSLRKMIYNSFRLKKKNSVTTVVEEEFEKVFSLEKGQNIFTRHGTTRRDPKTVFGPATIPQKKECSLVEYFQAEGKVFDPECRLTSFERKRRARHEFSEINHCDLQLFCPEQASQIEMRFTNASVKEVLLRVIAPNGEVSEILQPKSSEAAVFVPSNVGCGHGKWIIEMVVRDAWRFKYHSSTEIQLNGQGALTYQVDGILNLRLVDQLWLSFH